MKPFTTSASKVQESNLDEELHQLEATAAACKSKAANMTAPPTSIDLPQTLITDPYQLLHLPLPVNSPEYTESEYFPDKNTVWSILPSYHMYTSVVSKSLDLQQDDNAFVPPTYDDLSTLSSDPSVSANTNTLTNSNYNNSSFSLGRRLEQQQSPQSLGDNDRYIVADESLGQWQNTILDNIHNLKNLTDSPTNDYSKSLKVDMFFTEDVGEMNIKPTFIDILKYEYKQGDSINGYILVENFSSSPIPFDMFYVLFEGNFNVTYNVVSGPWGETKSKQVNKKFLEMFDFSASWHYGYINRLVTDFENRHTCSYEVDPLDNTVTSFGIERMIRPKTVYKRFFTFKIPEKLLDSSCIHNLLDHGELPPTTGISHSEKRNKHSPQSPKVVDYSFLDTSISYSINARFVGKASTYGEDEKSIATKNNIKNKKNDRTIINSGGDEFLILKDIKKPLRIVQERKKYSNLAKKFGSYRQDKIIYKNLVLRVDDYISLSEEMIAAAKLSNPSVGNGSDILTTLHSSSVLSLSLLSSNSNSGVNITAISSPNVITTIPLKSRAADEIAKCRQLYHPRRSNCVKLDSDVFLQDEFTHYKVFFPMQKKTFTGSSKYLGTLVTSTPKIPHIVNYIAPEQFCEVASIDDSSWKLEVPIDLDYVLLESKIENTKLPEIKNVKVELIVSTVKSESFPIPVQFNHDMIFESNLLIEKTMNLAHDYDPNLFDSNIVKSFKKKVLKLQTLSSSLGKGALRLESQLVSDMKSICGMKSKNINLAIDAISITGSGSNKSIASSLSSVPWEICNKSMKPDTFKKSFKLNVDLTTARLKTVQAQSGKAFNNFCLIPTFQLCYMMRLYYLKVFITLLKGEVLFLTVPIEIEK